MTAWTHFYFPTKVRFERDFVSKMGSMIQETGDRVLLLAIQNEITNTDMLEAVKSSIESSTRGCILYDDIRSPVDLGRIESAVNFARQSRCNTIVAFGSRETFYTARLISLLAPNEIFAEELSSSNYPTKKPPIPVVNVPAMPSMGEEVSPILSVYDREKDFFFQHLDDRLYPEMILFDSRITETLSESELAASGMAALAASIESILSPDANEVTTTLAIKAIELIEKNLVPLVQGGGTPAARNGICLASMMSGMAHSITTLGPCYAISFALNSLTSVGFYTAQAILLPHIMEYNLTNAAGKYVQIARAFEQETHDVTVIEAAIKSVESVRKMNQTLKLPQRISEFEVPRTVLRNVADLAVRSPFLNNTPHLLDVGEIEMILLAAY